MSKLISIIFALTLCITLHAQPNTYNPLKPSEQTWWTKWGHSTVGILYQITYHGLNAAGDAYLHRNKYDTHDPRDITIGKTLNGISQAMMFADYPLYVLTNKELKLSWGGFGKRMASTVFVRIIVFDPVHNIMIGEEFNYIGDIALTDKAQRKLTIKEDGWWAIRIVSVGMIIPLNYKIDYK